MPWSEALSKILKLNLDVYKRQSIMRLKKVAAAAMASTMVVSLAACGGGSESSSSSDSEGFKILISDDTSEGGAMADAAARYTEAVSYTHLSPLQSAHRHRSAGKGLRMCDEACGNNNHPSQYLTGSFSDVCTLSGGSAVYQIRL